MRRDASSWSGGMSRLGVWYWLLLLECVVLGGLRCVETASYGVWDAKMANITMIHTPS